MRFKTFIIGAFVALGLGLAACTPAEESGNQQPAAAQEQERPAAPARQTPPRTTPVATTSPTPVQIAQCTTASLRADGVTQAAARREAIGTEVTINGTKVRLAAGQTRWSLCSGPTLEQRLATAEARVATLTRERDAARTELATVTRERSDANAVIDQWVYVDPEAGNGVENTWKHQAEQDSGFGWLSWLMVFWAVGASALAAWLVFGRDTQRQAPIPATRPAPAATPRVEPGT